MKNLVISQILEIKTDAINKGYDFPTENPENATLEELESFLAEIKEFLNSGN